MKQVMSNVSDWDVIVVDDEPDNIGVIELVFDFQNVLMRVAESGQQCIKLLHDRVPTLLLVDIQMPDMSGYELLRLIRSNKDWSHLVIIAVTAYAMEEDARRIKDSGFDGHIAKPINVVTLIDEIQSIVEVSGG